MAFEASFPTWNRQVTVYRTIDDTAGATLRGLITGQIYTWVKRSGPICSDCGVGLLYEYLDPLILHPSDMLPVVGGESQHDVVTFPWPASPYDDGVFYGRVEGMGPRYDQFPNAHNFAILHMEILNRKELWFPESEPLPGEWEVGTVSVGNGECTDCSDLNAFSDLAEVDEGIWESDLLAWACLGTDVKLRLEITGPNAFLYLSTVPGGAIITYWFGSVVGWDGISAINLERGVASVYCDFSDPVVINPL